MIFPHPPVFFVNRRLISCFSLKNAPFARPAKPIPARHSIENNRSEFSLLDSSAAYIAFHATGHLHFGCVDIGAFAEKEVIQ